MHSNYEMYSNFTFVASVTFYVNVLGSSGNFEIIEGNSLVASGEVHEWRNVSSPDSPPSYECDRDNSISGADVYNELKMSGYEYGPSFQRILEIDMNGNYAYISRIGICVQVRDK